MKKFLIAILLVLSIPFSAFADETDEQQNPTFPIVQTGLGIGAGDLNTNKNGQGFFTGEFLFNVPYIEWDVLANVSAVGHPLAEFTEVRSRLHLIFLGIDDFTYRHYNDGYTLRALGGFNITKTWLDKARLNIGFGPSFFQEDFDERHFQYGVQISIALYLRFWRLESESKFSAYQNFDVDSPNVNLHCSVSDLECGTQGGILNDFITWMNSGYIFSQRLFASLLERNNHQFGVETEFRYEQLPFRRDGFWIFGSMKWKYGVWR